MAPRQINVEIYSKDFAPSTNISAKDAKELFFLTPAELKYVDYQQEKGWGGSCKLFNIHEIKRIAIRKLGSLQALIQKAEGMNTRRSNQQRRAHEKRIEEEQRRKDAIATAERLRLAEVERKKQIRSEKKRQAEQQAQDAASWRTLVEGIEEFNGMQIVSAETLRRMLEDVQVWKKRKAANDDNVDIQMPMPIRTTVLSSGLSTADDTTTTKTMTTEQQQQQNRKSMGDLYRRCCDVDFSDDSNSSSEEENDVNKKDRRGKGRGGGGKPGMAEISPPKKRKVVEGELHHATATITVTPK